MIEKHFLMDLAGEIGKLQRRAAAKGLKAAVRLNGTSDLPYERYKVPGTDKNIMELFPDVQFYDYTKLENRIVGQTLPANYHLTFSRAEDNDHKLRRSWNIPARPLSSLASCLRRGAAIRLLMATNTTHGSRTPARGSLSA